MSSRREGRPGWTPKKLRGGPLSRTEASSRPTGGKKYKHVLSRVDSMSRLKGGSGGKRRDRRAVASRSSGASAESMTLSSSADFDSAEVLDSLADVSVTVDNTYESVTGSGGVTPQAHLDESPHFERGQADAAGGYPDRGVWLDGAVAGADVVGQFVEPEEQSLAPDLASTQDSPRSPGSSPKGRRKKKGNRRRRMTASQELFATIGSEFEQHAVPPPAESEADIGEIEAWGNTDDDDSHDAYPRERERTAGLPKEATPAAALDTLQSPAGPAPGRGQRRRLDSPAPPPASKLEDPAAALDLNGPLVQGSGSLSPLSSTARSSHLDSQAATPPRTTSSSDLSQLALQAELRKTTKLKAAARIMLYTMHSRRAALGRAWARLGAKASSSAVAVVSEEQTREAARLRSLNQALMVQLAAMEAKVRDSVDHISEMRKLLETRTKALQTAEDGLSRLSGAVPADSAGGNADGVKHKATVLELSSWTGALRSAREEAEHWRLAAQKQDATVARLTAALTDTRKELEEARGGHAT